MKCMNCGYENAEGAAFCAGCGTRMQSGAPSPAPAPTTTYNQSVFNENNIPEEYRPISMWGYFGYELLFSIPCVGFILLLVFAFGGNKNKNVQNFARSYFCLLIIGIILGIVITVLAGGSAAFVSLSESLR